MLAKKKSALNQKNQKAKSTSSKYPNSQGRGGGKGGRGGKRRWAHNKWNNWGIFRNNWQFILLLTLYLSKKIAYINNNTYLSKYFIYMELFTFASLDINPQ